jgi:hypothetical protein
MIKTKSKGVAIAIGDSPPRFLFLSLPFLSFFPFVFGQNCKLGIRFVPPPFGWFSPFSYYVFDLRVYRLFAAPPVHVFPQ